MSWTVTFSKQSLKDAKRLKQAGLWQSANDLIAILKENPFQNPPTFEKLTRELKGLYSRRINKKHRLLYEVDRKRKSVYVVRMWSHYE